MKIDKWIYRAVFPEYEGMFEKIEAALGFKLFVWQKTFIVTGIFRQYGKTTAEILRELLDVAGTPIDYTTRPMNERERFYREETKKIQGRLHNAGIETRVIFWSAGDKRAYADMHHEHYRKTGNRPCLFLPREINRQKRGHWK